MLAASEPAATPVRGRVIDIYRTRPAMNTDKNKLTISTRFELEEDTPFCGYIDLFDEVLGIEGWAINKSNIDDIVVVELCVGNQVLATSKTGLPRDDLSRLLAVDITPGFRFDALVMRRIASEVRSQPNVQVQVCISETNFILSSDRPLPTVGRVARLVAEADERLSAEHRLSLCALLLRLADRANDLLVHSLRVIPENVQGYIETLTVNPAGYVWFIGWMNKGHLLEFSGVIADRGKTPCGIALLCYDRADLPDYACGVVGVIASEWQPNSLSQEFSVFFGRDARLYLRSHKPLRVLPASEFISEFEGIRAGCRNDTRGPAIMQLLNEREHWSLSTSTVQGFVAYASIDRLLLVPGFGYLAEGWIISPAKRMSHIQLRVSGKTLRCATETFYHKARPDLLQAYSGHSFVAQKAGFVGCFFSEARSGETSDPILRVVFEDGETWNQSVPTDAIRQLGHSAALGELRRFYPTLEDEPFFPRIATALQPARPAGVPRPHTVAMVHAVTIFMLPPDRCDLILLFTDIAHRLAAEEVKFGVAFVVTSGVSRPDAVRLFADMARNNPGQLSLFFANDDTLPFDVILPILEATLAQSFAFVGPSVFLSDAGWREVGRALDGPSDAIAFFELKVEDWQSEGPETEPLGLCFAWSAAAFEAWYDTAPRVLGGFFRDNGLLRWLPDMVLHKQAGRLTRRRPLDMLETEVNTRILEAHHA